MSVLPGSSVFTPRPTERDIQRELTEFCEYAYDFETNELLTDRNGRHYYVYGDEALKIWIYKCIITARSRYTAYTDRFGFQGFDLVGEVIGLQHKKEEMKRYIIEAVMVHPFVESIPEIHIESSGSGLSVEVHYTSFFGGEVESISCTVPIM